MLVHTVLMKFVPERAGDLDAIADRLRQELGSISSVRSLRVGVDERSGPNSMHIATILEFDDLAGLQMYLEAPAHIAVVQQIAPDIASSATVDATM